MVDDSVDDDPLDMVDGVAVKVGMVQGGGVTVTVVCAVTVLLIPVVVSLYVFVAVNGPVVIDPCATGVTTPILLSIVVVLQLVVFQLRVEDWPEVMELGVAEKSVMEHCGGGMTAMVLVAVAVLVEDVAVRVKVVVVVRFPEEMEPFTGTEPTVGEIDAVVQFEVVQAMVDAVL